MAVDFIRETYVGGREGGIDEFGARTYTRLFQVHMTNLNAGSLEVTDPASGYTGPSLGSTYTGPNGELDRGATCRGITAKQDSDDGFTWMVTCRYSSSRKQIQRFSENPRSQQGSGQQQGSSSETNPLLRLPEYAWTQEKFQKVIYKDFSTPAKPTVASNSERFDPPIVADDDRLGLTIQRNQGSYNASAYYLYTNTINDAIWIINGNVFPVGEAKCDSITAQSVFEMQLWYWRVSYKFSFKEGGWNLDVMDAGTFELDANNKPAVRKDQASGFPLPHVMPLDGAGKFLSLTPPITYIYKTFKIYNSKHFQDLGL